MLPLVLIALDSDCYIDDQMFAFLFKNRDLSQSERLKYGIKDNLNRFSFGVEDFKDLKADILQALEAI